MWSRDAASKDSDPIRPSEGIKAYALCPVFADTQLVRDSIKLYGKSKIEDLEKDTKVRVMDVSEVGHAFDRRLLGAVKVVFSKVEKFHKESLKRLKIQKWTKKIDLKIGFGFGFECWYYNIFVSFSYHVESPLMIIFGQNMRNFHHIPYRYCTLNQIAQIT